MRWEDHFAMATAGTDVLYRLDVRYEREVYVVMSVKTGEPCRWILERGLVVGWMVREAGLTAAEANYILWGADEWAKHCLTQPGASDCPAS